ncbi:MAG: hypothetical protein ACM3OA_10015, partial [Acidobacteriota bacterium]
FTVAVWVGNFNGTPMQGVGGITGGGPLLHRAALLVAQHVPPGTFVTPAEVGAVAVRICRLSGMRAGPECPPATEWFVPGTEPTQTCDWHQGGRVVLPVEYTDWAAQDPGGGRGSGTGTTGPPPAVGFHITSPQNGDRYSVPVGTDPRYATIALRTVGGAGVHWTVDGHAWRGDRWPIAHGRHTIRAVDARGDADQVSVLVE